MTKVKAKDLLHKEVIHKDYGLCFVVDVPKGSRAKVKVKVIQRGKGWDDVIESYKPVKRLVPNPDEGPDAFSIHYDLTRKDEYGTIETVHKNELKLCN
jgi:hypothetical protein